MKTILLSVFLLSVSAFAQDGQVTSSSLKAKVMAKELEPSVGVLARAMDKLAEELGKQNNSSINYSLPRIKGKRYYRSQDYDSSLVTGSSETFILSPLKPYEAAIAWNWLASGGSNKAPGLNGSQLFTPAIYQDCLRLAAQETVRLLRAVSDRVWVVREFMKNDVYSSEASVDLRIRLYNFYSAYNLENNSYTFMEDASQVRSIEKVFIDRKLIGVRVFDEDQDKKEADAKAAEDKEAEYQRWYKRRHDPIEVAAGISVNELNQWTCQAATAEQMFGVLKPYMQKLHPEWDLEHVEIDPFPGANPAPAADQSKKPSPIVKTQPGKGKGKNGG